MSSRQDGGLWRLRVDAPDALLAERAAAAFETVCGAVSAFETVPGGSWLIEGLALEPPLSATLDTLLALAWAGRGAPPAPSVERLQPRDWVAENQASFPPRRIGRYFVYGSHHGKGVPAGCVGLLIDAATAFGTGEHATTTGCLMALDGLAWRRRFRNVLDMGTGTGILAIAAAKTWRSAVLAADIDRGSVEVARINVARNGVADRVRLRWSDGYRDRVIRRGRPYGLVLANILARPLMAMSGDLARSLAPGGVVVLSGLLARQEPAVLAAHRRHGMVLLRRIAIDGWHTLVLER